MHLFRTSLNEGQLPDQWRSAKIIPLKKPDKGDYALAKAWRPISLLSTLGPCDASEREAQESVVNFEASMKSLLDQEMGQRMDMEQAELEINDYPAAIVLADVGPVVITALGYDGLDQLISLGEDVEMDD
ncbi:hypothetical protein EDB81DRAFT_820672 [Dactylonectria macrodidyma]|uniref:Uncharacterized protein n=1 Tax=Dactylonectria macrodidyma TaxID=307937 RepID=A0A9P9D9A5_9HYPO|nr:hypothetical protein EDB81DRAFT_820672 [Dactylonectria macrodidyma]